MSAHVRFAPSPTGLLHVGNARTALVNALFALSRGGRFLLRLDDTDRERSRGEYVDAIREDLRWLGLSWDGEARQSERLDRYQEVFEALRAAGRLYPCWETPEELEYKRKLQLARRKPPIYDRAALALSPGRRAALEAEGRRPHWRFLLDSQPMAWDDLVRGRVELRPDHTSDPVVVRADGTFLYMLPSVVDDADLGISHVVRGEDHVANTGVQLQMFRALGCEPPAFAHLPLLTDITGKGFSKRLGSMTMGSLREAGIEPMALAAYLARLGTGEPMQVPGSLVELARDFDIGRFGRATPKFDEAQLARLNNQLLHESPFDAVAARLAEMGLDRADAVFWEAVRPNLHRLAETQYWHDVCFGDLDAVIVDPEFARSAAQLLPVEPWGPETWEQWTRAVQEATGRRGKGLFQPLRLALTGEAHGPELRTLLPLIGRRRAEQRLRASPQTVDASVALDVAGAGR